MAERVDVTITYLRQSAPPALSQPAATPRGAAIIRAQEPPVHFYRYLYDLVGKPFHWVSRRTLNDAALGEIISHPDVYIYVLYLSGVPIGFSEIDLREDDGAIIRFFGLDQAHHGRGIGRYFLSQTIALAWSHAPSEVRLETCTLDHPAALPLYQKLGFEVFDQQRGHVELLPA